jgi:hypothetical protein
LKTITEYTKKQYDNQKNKKYYDKLTVARKKTAFSEKEAMKIFQQEMTYEFSATGTAIDTLSHKSVTVDGFDGFQSHTFSGQSNFGYSDVLMKRAKPLKYEFIPSTDRLNKNNGFLNVTSDSIISKGSNNQNAIRSSIAAAQNSSGRF